MGNTFTVSAWLRTGKPDAISSGYTYVVQYAGESLSKALLAAYRAKRAGSGCVKLEWR